MIIIVGSSPRCALDDIRRNTVQICDNSTDCFLVVQLRPPAYGKALRIHCLECLGESPFQKGSEGTLQLGYFRIIRAKQWWQSNRKR